MERTTTLTELQKIQNKDFYEQALGQPRVQKFSFYLGWHPKLYEGVDLDSATIDYINNHFFEYDVDCVNFHRHFLNALRHATPIYNNLKAVEFNKKVFDIITNKSVRKLAGTITANLKENGQINKLRNDTGTITDAGNIIDKGNTTENENKNETGGITETGSQTSSNRVSTDYEDNTKVATKELPMRATGDFEDLFDWAGASNVNETDNNGNKVEVANGTLNNNATTSNNLTTTNNKTLAENKTREIGNVRTLATQIRNEDTNNLTKINNSANNDKETIERITGQGVDLIRKIWNYLITPKAIDYLVSELEEAFITVY